MKSKRLAAFCITIALVCSVLWGCAAPAQQNGANAGDPSAAVEKSGDNASSAEAATAPEAAQANEASAEGFSWDMAKGTTVKVLFNQHPYADSIISKLPEFEEKTGIKVEYSITPEDNYFDKVTTSLNSRSGDSDIFMTGLYQMWDYATAGYMQALDDYAKDANLTAPDYNIDDFFPSVLDSLKWDCVIGHTVGTGSLWALPMGFEGNDLCYNKRIFEERGLKAPDTFEELMDIAASLKEFDGPGTYGIALRGTRSWATIITSYISTYYNNGAVDFVIENGKLVSKLNSPEAVEITDNWVQLIKNGGSPSWSSAVWYQASADLGAGKAAMLFDSNVPSTAQNAPGASQEAGNLAWKRLPMPASKTEFHNNHWTWALAMNQASKNKTGAWLFLQYFTGKDFQQWAAVNTGVLNTPRSSVFNSGDYQKILDSYDGYVEMFNSSIDNTRMLYTPQPYFFEISDLWAATIQDIVGGKYKTTQEGMDALKRQVDEIVADLEVG